MFSWTTFYNEMAHWVLKYRTKQEYLCEVLHKIGIESNLVDEDRNGNKPLQVMDPFTFFAFFQRLKNPDTRAKLLKKFKDEVGLKSGMPSGYAGQPSAQPMALRYFPKEKDRKGNEIGLLWDLAEQAVNGNLNDKTFMEVLKIPGIRLAKLTQGLFWLNPIEFYPIDAHKDLLIKNGINVEVKNLKDYLTIVEQVKLKFNKPLYEVSHDAWQWTNKNEETTMNNSTKQKYWIYSPGRNAFKWDEFYSAGIIALGWDELKDLHLYKDNKEITKTIKEFDKSKSSKSNDTLANVEFRDVMSIGDYVIVKKGAKDLLGYGKVSSDYYFDNERQDYKHCRKVEWLKKGNWDAGHNLVQKTLTNITKYKTENPPYTNYYEQLLGIMGEKIVTTTPHSLNQILFGPPGTGKTYNAIPLALKIIDKDFRIKETYSSEEWRLAKEKFDAFQESGQIEFVTFHQSMCYEDFVEGIKPTDDDGKVYYEIVDGIFKSICKKASTKNELNFENSYKRFISEIDVEDSDYLELQTKTNKPFWVKVNSNGNLNMYTTAAKNHQGVITKEKLKDFANGINTFIGWEGYATGVINHLKNKYNLLGVQEDNTSKNFVLIIDEINRGNVSAIFGELITLLEPAKRIGGAEHLKIKLPYSKADFEVPANLYIIGTMNTADRSVEALDTALRRRFSFVEMPPLPELLPIAIENDINLKLLLEKINSRIELLLDRDHLIGHSYLLNKTTLEDLKIAFHNNIIPLLQEYFYGDYGKIGLVIGEGFFEKPIDSQKSSFSKFYDYDSAGLEERQIYKLRNVEKMSIEDFVIAVNTLLK